MPLASKKNKELLLLSDNSSQSLESPSSTDSPLLNVKMKPRDSLRTPQQKEERKTPKSNGKQLSDFVTTLDELEKNIIQDIQDHKQECKILKDEFNIKGFISLKQSTTNSMGLKKQFEHFENTFKISIERLQKCSTVIKDNFEMLDKELEKAEKKRKKHSIIAQRGFKKYIGILKQKASLNNQISHTTTRFRNGINMMRTCKQATPSY